MHAGVFALIATSLTTGGVDAMFEIGEA